MLLKLEHDHHPCNLASLQYGSSGPSCQQVCLISEPDGQTSFIGLTFISLFSKDLASLINDCMTDDVPTVTVPIKSQTIEMLLKFLSTGETVSDDFENLFSLGKAASMLGIVDDNWTIVNSEEEVVDNKKGEITTLSVTWKSDEDIIDIKQLEEPTEAEVGESEEETVNDIVEKQFNCDVCGKSFTLVAKLAGHMLLKHDSVGMEEAVKGKCPICSKKRNKLFSHVWMHFQGCRSQRFKWNQCRASFVGQELLDTHKANHKKATDLGAESKLDYKTTSDPPTSTTCEDCGRKYTTRGALMAHRVFKHSSASSTTKKHCPICKKPVSIAISRGNLGHHINLHLEDGKRHHCNECSVSFYEKKSLVTHMRLKHKSVDPLLQ